MWKWKTFYNFDPLQTEFIWEHLIAFKYSRWLLTKTLSADDWSNNLSLWLSYYLLTLKFLSSQISYCTISYWFQSVSSFFKVHAIFYKWRFFSTQPQCCLTFLWIELQMLLPVANTYKHLHTEAFFIFTILVSMSKSRSIYVVSIWFFFYFHLHFHYD